MLGKAEVKAALEYDMTISIEHDVIEDIEDGKLKDFIKSVYKSCDEDLRRDIKHDFISEVNAEYDDEEILTKFNDWFFKTYEEAITKTLHDIQNEYLNDSCNSPVMSA